jgi:hypothetical protein
MKSEKAREFIDGCINNLTVDMADHAERQLRLAMTHTAELAEQEAEERMRKRAIGAFDDMWFENGEDGEFEPDYEYHRNNFIQKLTENENDD